MSNVRVDVKCDARRNYCEMIDLHGCKGRLPLMVATCEGCAAKLLSAFGSS